MTDSPEPSLEASRMHELQQAQSAGLFFKFVGAMVFLGALALALIPLVNSQTILVKAPLQTASLIFVVAVVLQTLFGALGYMMGKRGALLGLFVGWLFTYLNLQY